MNSISSYLKNDDVKRFIKEAVKPIVNVVYNEIYIYVWFICIYNVFLIFIILTNLYYLYKLSNAKNSEIKINTLSPEQLSLIKGYIL
jgi:hypothetical protein